MITALSLSPLSDLQVSAAYGRAVDAYQGVVDAEGSRVAAGASVAGRNLRVLEGAMRSRGLL